MYTKSLIFAFCLIGSGFLLFSCGTPVKEAEAENKSSANSENSLPAFTLSKGSLSSTIQIPGELIAYQEVDLYAKVNSFVKKLYVDVGSKVKEGQLLATLEAPEIESQLSGAESRLKSQEAIYLASKATYERLLQTSKTPGTVSQNDLDLALAKQNSDYAQFHAAQAAFREIQDNKNYLEVSAPFSGVISAREVSTGAYVGPSGKGSEFPMFTLQTQDRLRLVVSVPEAYTTYLNQQSKVDFTVKALPNQKFTAKVARLAGALDTRLRAQRTEMDVHNTDGKLLPGMVAEVSIPLTGTNSNFVIPSKAVLNSTEGTFVIKVDHDSTKWVPVQIGRQAEDKVEIFGDLREKDVLIQTANEEIRNNEPLQGSVKVN